MYHPVAAPLVISLAPLALTAVASGLVHGGSLSCSKLIFHPPHHSHHAIVRSSLHGTAADVEGAEDLASPARAAEANLFRRELDEAGLSRCHGMLHATGCRRISDVGRLTPGQIASLGASASDRALMSRVIDRHADKERNNEGAKLSTAVYVGRHILAGNRFELEAVCPENEIFRGRLFTAEQCNRLRRMSEYHAYGANADWIGMACRSVPGFAPATDGVFRGLFRALRSIYPGMRNPRFESANEPHLVRYTGAAAGAPLHRDNEHKSLTLNVLLSDGDDFGGGGTYLEAIDRTIKLDQGEMLIHPGNLLHAGKDISFGVRQLLVAFLECEWEEGDGEVASAPPL